MDCTWRLTFLSKARAGDGKVGDRTSALAHMCAGAVTVAGLCRTHTGFATVTASDSVGTSRSR